MINIIVGKKGSGKTKKLIELANMVTKKTDGAVLCIKKEGFSTFYVKHKARIIDSEDFSINNYDKLYGLICGAIASNYDIKDIFIDSTLRIGNSGPVDTFDFIRKLNTLSIKHNIAFYITLSCDFNEVVTDTWRFANKIDL